MQQRQHVHGIDLENDPTKQLQSSYDSVPWSILPQSAYEGLHCVCLTVSSDEACQVSSGKPSWLQVFICNMLEAKQKERWSIVQSSEPIQLENRKSTESNHQSSRYVIMIIKERHLPRTNPRTNSHSHSSAHLHHHQVHLVPPGVPTN